MIHPIPRARATCCPTRCASCARSPSGLRAAFEAAGYGEVWTPALEYEEVLRTGDENAAGAGFRMFDEQGHVLALRSDMTIPIARVVATRYADSASRCGCATSRTPTARWSAAAGQQREFLQGGMELIGVDGRRRARPR